MKFGMIGAGRLSQAIAGHAVKAGHEVVFSNSRGPDTLPDVVNAVGPPASAGTVASPVTSPSPRSSASARATSSRISSAVIADTAPA